MYRVHWQFEWDRTLCNQILWTHRVFECTTEKLEVTCTRCLVRLFIGETPEKVLPIGHSLWYV